MERVLFYFLPVLLVLVLVIVFTLIMTYLVYIIKKNNIKVKNMELHAGKHHWFRIVYK